MLGGLILQLTTAWVLGLGGPETASGVDRLCLDGEKPGGLDLTGASELEFWVRGAAGGETVNFVLGLLDGNQTYRDSAKGELNNVRLTAKWQKLRIPLDGRDLSRIKTGFGWSLAGQGKPVVFYLDDIRYVAP